MGDNGSSIGSRAFFDTTFALKSVRVSHKLRTLNVTIDLCPSLGLIYFKQQHCRQLLFYLFYFVLLF